MAAWSLRLVCLLLGLALLLPIAPRASAADEITITVEQGEATVTTRDATPAKDAPKDGTTKRTVRPGSPLTLPKGTEFTIETSPDANVKIRFVGELGEQKLELGAKTAIDVEYDPDDQNFQIEFKAGSIVMDATDAQLRTLERAIFTPRGLIQAWSDFLDEPGRIGVSIDPESGAVTIAVEKGEWDFRPGDRSAAIPAPDRKIVGPGDKLTITKDGVEKGATEPGTSLFNNLDPLEPDRDGTKAQGSENPGTDKPEQPKDKGKEDDKDKDQQAFAITSAAPIPFIPKVPPQPNGPPQLPVLSFETATKSVLEGNSGLQSVSTKLLLNPASSQKVTVQIQSQDGTATTADGDYPAQSDLLTFLPGQTEVIVNSFYFGDTKVEPQEFFKKFLFNPKGATLGQNNAIFIFLTNDD